MKDTGLIEYWENSGINLNPGTVKEEIMILERYLDFTFPKSFKELYLEMDGFYNGDMDDGMFSMMPLKRIKEEYDDSKNKDFIPFCDYLINSHQIGFSKKEKGVFIDYWSYPHKFHNDKVANTFIESLIEIINDSEKAN